MSSDNGAFVDLTSSPYSSPHSAARDGPVTMSTVELAGPSLDLAGARASLSAFQQPSTRPRHCASFVRITRFCVASSWLHELDSTRKEFAECLNALQERLDNYRELEACRLRYHDLQLRYREAVSEFQDRISTLEAQLVTASFFGVIVPPDTARRIADLESQLERSQYDLKVERDRQSSLASEHRESATSHKAAQAEVNRLKAAIERKPRRFRTLRDNYERRLKVADNTIATHSAELDRLQDQVSTLDRDLLQVSPTCPRCDQAKAERIATQDRVSAARDTIARLEKRINQIEKYQKSRQDLEFALAALQQERGGLVVQRDELLGQLRELFMEVTDLRAERDQAEERLSSIASLLPSTLGHKRARSQSDFRPSLLASPRSLDRLQVPSRVAR
ncbi:hypothetical protein F443_20533 [Phytophthora nicotianae P1569]|uniref:Uncharacterized protein n=1 Tax=Phytophthora nicotianae P1569 TaxID=1317065 RepID=V9E0U6_PHYNI|nr:hypothetical protein F443_20533 [Phytophthora nicotianae P1569]